MEGLDWGCPVCSRGRAGVRLPAGLQEAVRDAVLRDMGLGERVLQDVGPQRKV